MACRQVQQCSHCLCATLSTSLLLPVQTRQSPFLVPLASKHLVMSANKKKSVLDQLIDAGSDSDSEDDQQVGSGAGKQAESAGSGSDGEEETAAAKRAKKAAISLEDLQRAGYNSGPSVLLMKAPQEQQEQQWNWCVRCVAHVCAWAFRSRSSSGTGGCMSCIWCKAHAVCMGLQEQEQLGACMWCVANAACMGFQGQVQLRNWCVLSCGVGFQEQQQPGCAYMGWGTWNGQMSCMVVHMACGRHSGGACIGMPPSKGMLVPAVERICVHCIPLRMQVKRARSQAE